MVPGMPKHILEPSVQRFAKATSELPRVYELDVEKARKSLEELQAVPIYAPDVDSTWLTLSAEGVEVQVRIVRPAGATELLPVVLYLHGGGWVLGSAATHDRLVRELAVGAHAAVVFVDYDRAPEARYPVAIEQAYAAARWIHNYGASHRLDADRLAVAGDSAGGNLAASLAILAKHRGGVTFIHQSLYYPVTDASMTTASYDEFADGPHLTAKAMNWFWDAYLPDMAKRREITASPLRASLDELAGLPDAFIVVDECDVLRDEGEAYARKLVAAGVRCASVRYNATQHDFMMLNPLRESTAATRAICQAIHVLRQAFQAKERQARSQVR